MAPHQERVVTEKAELDEKRMKLDAFIDWDNAVFRGLPADEQARLGRQLAIMDQYSRVLGERIAAF